MWFCVRAPAADGLSGLHVRVSLLFDRDADQVNIVQATSGPLTDLVGGYRMKRSGMAVARPRHQLKFCVPHAACKDARPHANLSLTVPLRSTVVASRDQVSCALGEEGAILHLQSGLYYGLNRVGAKVWALIQEPIVVEQLRDQLLARFDVPQDRLDHDLGRLLDDFVAEGLVEIRDEPAR